MERTLEELETNLVRYLRRIRDKMGWNGTENDLGKISDENSMEQRSGFRGAVGKDLGIPLPLFRILQ